MFKTKIEPCKKCGKDIKKTYFKMNGSIRCGHSCPYCNKGILKYPDKTICRKCKTPKSYLISEKQFLFRCSKCTKENYDKRRRKARLKCMQYIGDIKCNKCGNADSENLQFHHPNQLTKKFAIGSTNYALTNKLKAELNKCILLCIPCHNECHKHGTHPPKTH